MRRSFWTVTVALSFITVTRGAQAEESMAELLERGVYQEQTRGDCEAAIKIYQRIVAHEATDMARAAEAQFRIGACWIRLGAEKDAAYALGQIADLYPTQKYWVRVAQNELKAIAPAITSTQPALLAEDVSADVGQISVTFDRAMRDRSWAWVRTDSKSYPELVGRPGFDDQRRTCTQQVKLKPGTVYRIGLNTPPYIGFHSETGVPAKEHLLVFATRQADGRPTPIPLELRAEAAAINEGQEAPEVAATNPLAFANSVNASLKAISVTFDQPMRTTGWSWVKRYADRYPEKSGEPRYTDERTCALPVTLEPGKVYWLEINSDKHASFKSASGVSARPFVLLFATAQEDGSPTPIPASLLEKAKGLY